MRLLSGLSARQGREETGIEACFDGARNVELAPLDEVRVTKSIKTTSIIKISEAGFWTCCIGRWAINLL